MTKITGGNEMERTASAHSTRHITPQICVDSSASTSRAVSRVSAASSRAGTTAPTPVSGVTWAPNSGSSGTAMVAAPPTNRECRSGGLHPPSSASVQDFVRQVRGRIRYFSVCGPESGIAADVASVVASINEESASFQLKRATSCPDEHQIRDQVQASTSSGQLKPDEVKIDPGEAASTKAGNRDVVGEGQLTSTSVQTDEFQVFPYEHLFPSVLPQWFVSQGGQPQVGQQRPMRGDEDQVNPYNLLDDLVKSASSKGRC